MHIYYIHVVCTSMCNNSIWSICLDMDSNPQSSAILTGIKFVITFVSDLHSERLDGEWILTLRQYVQLLIHKYAQFSLQEVELQYISMLVLQNVFICMDFHTIVVASYLLQLLANELLLKTLGKFSTQWVRTSSATTWHCSIIRFSLIYQGQRYKWWKKETQSWNDVQFFVRMLQFVISIHMIQYRNI